MPRRNRQLDHLTTRITTIDWQKITAQIMQHLEIERRWPTTPDGYPTRTPGANPSSGGSGHIIDAPGDEGHGEAIDLTTVEAAAEARAFHHDRHATLVSLAQQALRNIDAELTALQAAITQLDKVPVPQDVADQADAMWCTHCLTVEHNGRPLDHHEVRADRYAGLGLCRWCGDFRNRWQRLPPAALVDMHARGIAMSEATIQRHLKPAA